jgi:hypothetical protein
LFFYEKEIVGQKKGIIVETIDISNELR